jgi:hypothetical protein
MNKLKFLLLIIITVILIGCPARTFYPLFAEKDLVFNPALVGTWTVEGDTYIFQKSGEKSYELTHFQNDNPTDTAVFKAQLGKLGKYWFLDLFPESRALESHLNNGVYTHHLILAHTISRVWFEGDSMRIATLEDDWLRKMIENKKLKVPYVHNKEASGGEQLLLTASTKELQRLVVKYADNREAFPEPGVLLKVKP